jgi:hypothetical protein
MNHRGTFVTNNDGYLPDFLIAPEPAVDSQRYFLNPEFLFQGTVNERGLTFAGERYLSAMRNRGMIVDVEHLSAETRADVYDESIRSADCTGPPYSPDCVVRAYPVIASHSDLRWSYGASNASERTLSSTEVQHILRTGGVIGLSTGYELHRDAAQPLGAGRSFAAFNDCPGSSKSFSQKMLAYIANGEHSGTLTNYFTGSSGTYFSHPIARPPHWSAVGVGLGSDMNGFAIQLGARFNPNAGTSCYGRADLKFDANDDPDSMLLAQQQRAQANAVYYGGAPSPETLHSVAPAGGIPPQPPLKPLRFDANIARDVYVEQPVDVSPPLTAPSFTDLELRGFDFNAIGMANIGLEPDMLQDMVNGMRRVDVATFTDMRYQVRYLMRSAEDFIQTWERSVDWCVRSGSPNCGFAPSPAPDTCDVWTSDVDSVATLSDDTPSCMARCGRTLQWSDADGSHACRCWIGDGDEHPTDLCEDFKPWCQWFYNGADDPSGGRVLRGSP